MNKVYRGTPRSDSSSMCLSCRNARVTRGINNQELIYCRADGHSQLMSFPVTECSVFDDKRIAPLYEMQNIAWIVKSRNRGPLGFKEDEHTEIVVESPEQRRHNDVPE